MFKKIRDAFIQRPVDRFMAVGAIIMFSIFFLWLGIKIIKEIQIINRKKSE